MHPEHNFQKFYTVKPGDIYVEVGAALGSTAFQLPVTARKILIEASPINADYLDHRIQVNELGNAVVIRTAIASTKGTMAFRMMGPRHVSENRLVDSPSTKLALQQNEERGKPPTWNDHGEPVGWGAYTIQVPTDTLEGILDGIGRYEADMFFGLDQIDLLASDCESCEFDMVKYAGKWLDPKKVRNWAIGAYHIPGREPELFKALQDAGYRTETDLGGGAFHGPQLVIYGLSP